MAKTILIDDENFNCFADPDCFAHLSEQMASDDKWAYVGRIDTEKTLVSTKYFVNRHGEWKIERNASSGKSFKIYSPSSKFVLAETKSRKHYGNYVYCTVGSVHRLVAKAFLPNPNNFPEVDHIDGNPSNNNVSNLRWVTHSQNLLNPKRTQRAKQTCKSKWSKVRVTKERKAIVKYSLDFKERLAVYKTFEEAAVALNMSKSNIVRLCSQNTKCSHSRSQDYWLRRESVCFCEMKNVRTA